MSRSAKWLVVALMSAMTLPLFSCGAGDGGVTAGREPVSGNTREKLAINLIWPAGYSFDSGMPLLHTPASKAGRAAPSYVTRVTLTISGEGMSPLVLDVPLDTLTVDYAIPPGVRTFTILVETNIPGLSFTDTVTMALTAGATLDIDFSLEINAPPQDIRVTASSDTTYKNIEVTVTATVEELDPDDNPTITWDDGGGTMGRSAGDVRGREIGWSINWSASRKGTYQVCATVNDGEGGSASGCVTITVLNRDPSIGSVTATGVADNACSSNEKAELHCSASDPDGDSLSYFWTGPEGWSASGASAEMCDPAQGDVFTCKATDGDGGSDSESVTYGGGAGVTPWTRQRGSAQFDDSFDIAVDSGGNVYVVGYSNASWGAPVNAHSGGLADIVLAKFDSSGNLLWNTFAGAAGNDYGYAVAVDNVGGVYISGFSRNSWGAPVNAHADPGVTDNIAVAKFNSNDGTLAWNTFAGGAASGNDSYGYDINIAAGALYVVGYSIGAWGAPVNAYSGGADMVVVKLDTSGNRLWHTFAGSGNTDYGYGVAPASGTDIFIVGSSNATFGAPVSAFAGTWDAVVARFDTNGNRLWHTFMGSGSSEFGISIGSDSSGFAYITGYGNATFGAPINAYTGGWDFLTAKFAANGGLLWHTFDGAVTSDSATRIDTEAGGTSYVSGYSSSSWGAPQSAYTAGVDMAIAAYDSNGARLWNRFEGSAGTDYARGVDYFSGATYVCGSTDGNMEGVNAGGMDIVALRR